MSRPEVAATCVGELQGLLGCTVWRGAGRAAGEIRGAGDQGFVVVQVSEITGGLAGRSQGEGQWEPGVSVQAQFKG